MDEEVQKALDAYLSLKKELGKNPSSREFFKVFPKRKLYKGFEGGNAYSRLQELAGDDPHVFSSGKSDLNEIQIKWAELARKTLKQYGKLPVQYDWSINGIRPTVSGIEKSHGIKWSEIPHLFKSEFYARVEWEDVLNAIPVFVENEEDAREVKREGCFVYLIRDLRNSSHKIGISNNPGKRERTLQSEQPKTELVAAKRYINRNIALNIEKALHETYKHKRKRGEWFNLDEEDLNEIIETLND